MSGKILVIAGLDSGGAAGITNDILVIHKLKHLFSPIITSTTIQNYQNLQEIYPISSNFLVKQIKNSLLENNISAIKIGMIGNVNNLLAIAKTVHLYANNIPIILDPILSSSGNDKLFKGDDFLELLKRKLFKKTYLLTPNIPEAEKILDIPIKNKEDMVFSAKRIQEKFNIEFVLLKGGHLTQNTLYDVLVGKNLCKIYQSKKIKTAKTYRGTGCFLATAISCFLSEGKNIDNSVKKARKLLRSYLKKSTPVTKDINILFGYKSIIKLK